MSGALAPGRASSYDQEPAALEVEAVPAPPEELGHEDPLGRPSPDIPGAKPAETVESADADPWAEAFAESARLEAAVAREAPDYPVVMNAQIQFFLDRFTGSERAVMETWLDRSGKYLGMIRDVFHARGLPTDLAFTVLIESGFNPLAVSRAGAKGLWQFMATTARRYGLRVDRWVDERLDPEKATVAAAAYLRDLHTQFGSWCLAQAAYNAGEVAVARAIRATGSSDFWVLNRTRFLRRETQAFVPAIQAATLIGRNPGLYGFELGAAGPTDLERVSVPASTDLRRLAAASGISLDRLRALNAALVKSVTPPGTRWELRVPGGARDSVLAALARHRAGARVLHVVRPRDTVSSIAQQYGISVDDVVRWNSLEHHARIHPGDRLRVAELR